MRKMSYCFSEIQWPPGAQWYAYSHPDAQKYDPEKEKEQ